MGKTRAMNVTLTDDLASFVDQQIETGRHTSQSDVMRAALNLYRDADDMRKLEWLRKRFAQPSPPEKLSDGDEFMTKLIADLRAGVKAESQDVS